MKTPLRTICARSSSDTTGIPTHPDNKRVLVLLCGGFTNVGQMKYTTGPVAWICQRVRTDDGRTEYGFTFYPKGCGVDDPIDFGSSSPDEFNFIERIESSFREHGVEFVHPQHNDYRWLQLPIPIPTGWVALIDYFGYRLLRERYYGFDDSGGVYGDSDGYETLEQCVAGLRSDGITEEEGLSTDPADLGKVLCVVLKCEVFVNAVLAIEDYQCNWTFGTLVTE